MGKATNQIATRKDINDLYSGTFSSNLNKCITKYELFEALGDNVRIINEENYKDQQLIPYPNIDTSYTFSASIYISDMIIEPGAVKVSSFPSDGWTPGGGGTAERQITLKVEAIYKNGDSKFFDIFGIASGDIAFHGNYYAIRNTKFSIVDSGGNITISNVPLTNKIVKLALRTNDSWLEDNQPLYADITGDFISWDIFDNFLSWIPSVRLD